MSNVLTVTLAPDNAKEGVLHDVVDVDIQRLNSHVLELIRMVPELETDPNLPLKETNVAPVVGKFVILTPVTVGASKDRAFVRPDPAIRPVVTTTDSEASAWNVWSLHLSAESEVHKEVCEALPKILALEDCDKTPRLFPKTTATTDPVRGKFVLLTLEEVGTLNDTFVETEPTCCCTVITKLSEAPTPAATFTEAEESLIQREAIADEVDTRVLTLLSEAAKLKPTAVTETLPLEGAQGSFITAARAGTLNETAEK